MDVHSIPVKRELPHKGRDSCRTKDGGKMGGTGDRYYATSFKNSHHRQSQLTTLNGFGPRFSPRILIIYFEIRSILSLETFEFRTASMPRAAKS